MPALLRNGIAYLFLFSCTINNAVSWQQILTSKKDLFSNDCHQLLSKQLAAYSERALPKISDPEIKQIPIQETDELCVCAMFDTKLRIRMLPMPATPLESPDCNSGYPAASEMRYSVAERLNDTLKHLDRLASHFGYEPGQLSILIFEGLRTIETQTLLFAAQCTAIRAKNPHLTEEEVESEASRWVSPVNNNVPAHSTGAAIDIRLWDSKKQSFVDCGPFGVIWGPNATAPTFSENLSDEQKNNRLLLLAAAAEASLINYGYEWWHFSWGDRYAMFWHEENPEKRVAFYDSL